MALPSELTAEDIRAYLDRREPAEDRSSAHIRAYREAAAVLVAVKDVARLRPCGPAPAGAAAELLGSDLIPATGAIFGGEVMLTPDRQLIMRAGVTQVLRYDAVSSMVSRAWSPTLISPRSRTGRFW